MKIEGVFLGAYLCQTSPSSLPNSKASLSRKEKAWDCSGLFKPTELVQMDKICCSWSITKPLAAYSNSLDVLSFFLLLKIYSSHYAEWLRGPACVPLSSLSSLCSSFSPTPIAQEVASPSCFISHSDVVHHSSLPGAYLVSEHHLSTLRNVHFSSLVHWHFFFFSILGFWFRD